MGVEVVFTALADQTRREVISALARHQSCTATELASGMPITRQAVAKHLMHLRRANLVQSERRGRETRYRLTPQALTEAIGWLEDMGGQPAHKRAA